MLKLVSLMARLTVIAGVMLSLQSVAAKRLAQARKAADGAGMAAYDDKGNPLPNENGSPGPLGFDLASTFLKLLPGHTGPSNKPAPSGPSTLIRYVGSDGKNATSARTVVTELPPGAKAIVVDGRLQIYCPSSPPQVKNGDIAAGQDESREERRDSSDPGGKSNDIGEIIRLIK